MVYRRVSVKRDFIRNRKRPDAAVNWNAVRKKRAVRRYVITNGAKNSAKKRNVNADSGGIWRF